jgi:hypothetical protein
MGLGIYHYRHVMVNGPGNISLSSYYGQWPWEYIIIVMLWSMALGIYHYRHVMVNGPGNILLSACYGQCPWKYIIIGMLWSMTLGIYHYGQWSMEYIIIGMSSVNGPGNISLWSMALGIYHYRHVMVNGPRNISLSSCYGQWS